MKLDIFTPEQVYFSGEVTAVTLPGAQGTFTMLENHAPLISSLAKGRVEYAAKGVRYEIMISGGFVEMNNNKATLAIESIEINENTEK